MPRQRRTLRLALAAALGALVLFAAPARACTGAQCYVSATVLGESPATGGGVFRFPQAVAYSPGGAAIFVADQYSSVVQRFDRVGAWQGELGAWAGDREPGRIGVVGGLATDRAGHVFVLDSENDRVQVFAVASGRWLAAWGGHGSGAGQFRLGANTGAGGIAIDQPTPDAVPVVYIADQYNHRIQAFRLEQDASADPTHPVLPPGPRAGDVVAAPTRLAGWGAFGDCAASGCADPAFDQRLNHPQGVAVDSRADDAGRRHVLVADDDNHRVVEYLPDGTFVRQVGGYGTAAGQFRFPYDVGVDARDPRQLYVADNNNHRVQAFDLATLAFQRLWGAFGPQLGNLEYPRALAALADDPRGGVAVADTANNRVQTFAADGARTGAWGIAGRGPGYVTRPRGVAIDAGGTVHVADTLDHRVERLAPDGAYLGQTGYVAASSGFAAPASGDGQFDAPGAIAHDPRTGHVWVADTGNDRVQELSAEGAWVATHGGPGTGPGRFSAPGAVALDAAGGVLVADTGNDRVQRLDPATGAWSALDLGGEALTAPAGVAAAADGSVYVADTGADRVLRVRAGRAAALEQPPPGGLHAPAGLFANGADLYVADSGADRVLRFAGAAGRWDVIGTAGTAVGAFLAPSAVATDPAGDALVVADTGNDRVQRFTLRGTPPAPTARLDVELTGVGEGLVASDPPGIACPTDCRQSFHAGATVTLRATPAAGWVFAGWSGACTGTDACLVALGAAATVSAAFAALPAPPPPPAPAPTPPRAVTPRPAPPVLLRAARLTPAAFRARGSGPAIRPSGGGALLVYTLTRRASVTATLQRASAGIRIGGRCLQRTAARRRGPPCTRYARAGRAIRLPGGAGAHRLRLTGRIGGRALRPGRYRLVLRAIEAGGARAVTRALGFRILAARARR